MHNINSYLTLINDIKEPTHVYQNCKINKMLIFNEYLKVSIFLNPDYHLNQDYFEPYWYYGDFYLGVKILAWYIDPNDFLNENILKYPCPTGIKIGGILNIQSTLYKCYTYKC